MSHALTRTSPKGTDFVGTCLKCGKENLGPSSALVDCPMDTMVSDSEALLHVLSMESKNEAE